MKTAPKTTTALAIPQFSKVSPKPTKTEILEALVQRAKVKHDLEEETRKIKADALLRKIERTARDLAKKEKDVNEIDYVYYSEKKVRFTIWVKSPELSSLIEAHSKIKHGSTFDYQSTKRLLREKLAGAPERCRLLDSPEAVKALDHMLESFA